MDRKIVKSLDLKNYLTALFTDYLYLYDVDVDEEKPFNVTVDVTTVCITVKITNQNEVRTPLDDANLNLKRLFDNLPKTLLKYLHRENLFTTSTGCTIIYLHEYNIID